jgi:murein DD-endopeptidase MepM/ murein hydrolase activator NlpD
MHQEPYFVVVLAHSLHGRLRRIHIPHRAIYAVLVLALIGLVTVCGFAFSYARMTWKVARYNSLRREVDVLRTRYRDLQTQNRQKTEELATLQLFASEVRLAYGLDNKAAPGGDHDEDPALIPSYHESLEDYAVLEDASSTRVLHQYPKQWLANLRPSMWPLDGRLLSPFGARTDPFSGEGAIHTGVDISATIGTPVRATADGIVAFAGWMSGYGHLLEIEHENGMRTYYAHLSAFEVVPGQEVRRGEVVALSGASGHVTAPHLHYEVRIGGTPVNPYPYLAHSAIAAAGPVHKDFPF